MKLSDILKHISLLNRGLLAIFSLFAISCGSGHQHQPSSGEQDLTEPLIRVNKKLVVTEDQRIDDFIARYNWKMNSTPTGLRYQVYKKGLGPEVAEGDRVRINYAVVLLNGDTVYTSQERGPKEFIIGQGSVEDGLEEGLLLLKKGDKAKIIIPSHIAFGLVGDMDKIPAKATLVYDVELFDIIKN